MWFHLCSSFTGLLWLFWVFFDSIQIIVFFFLFLWKSSLEFLYSLHWICKWLWVIGHFNNVNSLAHEHRVFLHLFVAFSIFSNFQYMDLSLPCFNVLSTLFCLFDPVNGRVFSVLFFSYFIISVEKCTWFLCVDFISYKFSEFN